MILMSDNELLEFYKGNLREINRQLETLPKRSPQRNRLHLERKMVLNQIKNFASQHTNIVPIEYGVW